MNQAIDQLKKEVGDTFGRQVLTARDCTELSEAIYAKTHERLHLNTLRRMFGLVKTPFQPAVSTLAILARYCGYESLEYLPSAVTHKEHMEFIPEKSLVNFFSSLFRSQRLTEEAIMPMLDELVNFFNHHPSVARKIQKQIAKTPMGQKYFELAVNVDRLADYYGDGLYNYINEKRSRDAQIFGHALLCHRNWLAANGGQLERHFQSMVTHRLDHSIQPSIAGHYFAACIYRYHYKRQDSGDLLRNAQRYYIRADGERADLRELNMFRLTLADSLLHTAHYDEGLDYITEFEGSTKRSQMELVDLKHKCAVLKTFALAHIGKRQKALTQLEKINNKEFSVLCKKYLTITYLLARIKLGAKNAKVQTQLKTLINETGFVMLEGS